MVAAGATHQTIYNPLIRWSELGVFSPIFAALAAMGGKPDQFMIDTTHRRYDADWLRHAVNTHGLTSCFPSKSNR